MTKKTAIQTKNRLPRRVWVVLSILVVLLIGGVVLARHAYNNGLEQVSSSQQTQIFTVERGASVEEIGNNLEKAKLIKSAWAFELYIHSKELGDKLQAGTYAFSPSQGTKEIVNVLTKGQVTTKLVTILPGRRIDQVRADLINDGFSPPEVDAALDPGNYKDLPVLAFKPQNVNSLEGLLWPESFQRDASTEATVIVRQSLEEMGKHLTPDVQAAFAAQGLTTYQGLILASVVIQEVGKAADQTQAAQVFVSRLKAGRMLESDATAKYGAILAGKAPSLTYESPYNTYSHAGLPPTPISTVSASALDAAARPATTSWLYFVSGDDGTTHFSKTLEEHQALTNKYCTKLCGR